MQSDRPSFVETYLPYLLRQADQTLSAPFYDVLVSYGIARSDWRVLAVLAEHDELGVVDLAALALSPQPTVTHALRRLEQRGLITRTPGTTDRRQRVVSITRTGSKLTATLIAEARRLESEALVDAGDLTELADRLRELTVIAERAIAHRAGTEAG